MNNHDEHEQRLDRAVAAAMQGFYNCHGDEERWEQWEFEAEKKLLDTVRAKINREDGYLY